MTHLRSMKNKVVTRKYPTTQIQQNQVKPKNKDSRSYKNNYRPNKKDLKNAEHTQERSH